MCDSHHDVRSKYIIKGFDLKDLSVCIQEFEYMLGGVTDRDDYNKSDKYSCPHQAVPNPLFVPHRLTRIVFNTPPDKDWSPDWEEPQYNDRDQADDHKSDILQVRFLSFTGDTSTQLNVNICEQSFRQGMQNS